MSFKPKKKNIQHLLKLLGADPNEPAPVNFEEARFQHEQEHGEVERVEMPRCPVSGKVGFSSESTANRAANARLKKGSNVGKLRVFRCPDCNKWHFTSSFKTKF